LTNWTAVWVIFAGGLAAGAYMTKVPPALPAMRPELGLTLIESGFIATTFNLMGMLVGILAGVLCDRFGHKRLALAGLTVMAAGGVLGAASLGFATLLASRFFEGIGFILFSVSAVALMNAAAATPRDRAKALGLWSAYMPTGGSIALLAAPLLLASWGWRGLWLALALAAALCAVALARLVPASQRHGEVDSMKLIVESLSQKGSMVLAALFAFYVGQWTSVMIWLPTFLVEHQVSAGTAAAATAMMVVANIPGNLAGGWLLSRGVARGNLVTWAAAIAALCEIGMLADALPGALRYALVLAFSACAGVIPAAIFAGMPVHARTPQHIGTANGIVMQASQLGQFLGPMAIAWVASRFSSWSAALWVLLAFAAGAAVCGIAIGRIEKRIAPG
jgi:MFS transporter, DHA1 family, inner membrane transport protein